MDGLLGRQRLLDAAVRHLEQDGGVVLAGLPWVGRTRLLREALTRAEGDHVMIRATRSGAAVPFGNLGPVAPGDPDDPTGWLEDLRARLPGPDTILAIDGAQFLDDHSALLLLQAAEGGAVRLAVSVWRSHPAPDAVTSLWTDGLLPRLEVEPVDRGTSDELVRQALGGEVEEATLLRLWDICRGYPLLIREYIAGSRAEGLLVRHEGLWVARDRPVHTPTMVDTAQQVRTGLSAAAVEALELLAVAQPLDAFVADQLIDPETLDQLERWDLFVHDEQGDYALPAPGWAEAIEAGLTSVRRRQLITRLVAAMPAVSELAGEELVRVVCWHREAGLPVPPEQVLRGAESARDLGDVAIATELAEAALDVDPVRARMVLADARARSGRVDEAVRLLAEVAERTPDHSTAARALVTAARLEFFRAGRPDAAVELLEDGVLRTDDPEARAIVHAELGLLHALRGELPAALDMAGPVADADRPSPLLRFAACRSATVAAMWTGHLTDARRYLSMGRAAADALEPDVPSRLAVTLEFCEPTLLMVAGRPSQAIERSEAGYEESLASGATADAGVWAVLTSLVARPAGRLGLAARRASEAIALAERDDEHGILPTAWGARSMASLTTGDLAEGRRALARLDALPRVPNAHLAVLRHHIVAGIHALEGDVPAGARAAAAAGEEAADRGQSQWAAHLLHVAVRFGYPELVADRLAEVTAPMEGDLAPLWAEHARALLDGDPGMLERVAEAFLGIGFGLWGAEALVQAAGLHAHAGRAGRARAVRARATMLLEELPGLRTPALRGFGTEPLTRREREVAVLAGEGRTSREIAEQLVVSVRTVDNHLASVYRKLGIGGRHELGYIMSGQDPGPA